MFPIMISLKRKEFVPFKGFDVCKKMSPLFLGENPLLGNTKVVMVRFSNLFFLSAIYPKTMSDHLDTFPFSSTFNLS